MHELSIAMSVCQMAEDRIGAQALPQVISVVLTVGDDSGSNPISCNSVWTHCSRLLRPGCEDRDHAAHRRRAASGLLEVDDGS